MVGIFVQFFPVCFPGPGETVWYNYWHMIYKFNNLPMAVKISILFLPILFVIFITDEIAYQRMEETVYEETAGAAAQSVRSVTTSLDSTLENITNVFQTIAKSSAIREYSDYYTHEHIVHSRGTTVENNLSGQLKMFMSSLPSVNGMGIALSSYRIKYVTEYDNNEAVIHISDYFKAFPETEEPSLVKLSSADDSPFIYVCPVNNGYRTYTLFATIRPMILSPFEESLRGGDVDYFIFSGENCIYSTNSDPELYSAALDTARSHESPANNPLILTDDDNHTFILSSSKSIPWSIVAVPKLAFPKDALTAAYRISMYSRIICGLITIFLYVLIMYVFINQLNTINHSMIKVESGDRDAVFRSQYTNELGQLSNHLDNMIATIRKQEQEIDRKEMEVQRAQLKALQNQINPHFLYNALEHIRMQAVAQDSPDLAEQIHTLGELLRYNIHNELNTVTVRQEVEQVSRYLSMQKHILGERLNVIIDFDSSAMDCYVIKFLLQPLVENAVIHGISPALTPSDLYFSIKDDGEYLDFEINDTGVGITEETLDVLLAALREPGHSGEGSIGLINVNDRLKLFYKGNEGITIESKPGNGTRITFRIPVMREPADMNMRKENV